MALSISFYYTKKIREFATLLSFEPNVKQGSPTPSRLPRLHNDTQLLASQISRVNNKYTSRDNSHVGNEPRQQYRLTHAKSLSLPLTHCKDLCGQCALHLLVERGSALVHPI